MAPGLLIIPNFMPALDANANPSSGAQLFVYENETTTFVTIYADAAMATPLANPLSADSAGRFPLIYVDVSVAYSVKVTSSLGVVYFAEDNLFPIPSPKIPVVGNIAFEKFGAVGDGVTDNAAAVTALNTYVAAAISQFAAIEDTYNLIQSGLTVDLTGIYAFSNSIITYPGVHYYLPTGSRLVALAAGQVMVRSPTLAELAASGAGAIYGTKAPSLTGGGIIDGNNLATFGRLLNTTAEFGRDEYIVTRCTHRKYSTTVTGTAGNATVSLGSAANVAALDVIDIPSDANRFYSVLSVNAGAKTAVLNRGLAADAAAVSMINRAAGLEGAGAQQSLIEVDAHGNDIGAVWGFNSDGIPCTDMVASGKSMFHANMIGEVCISFGPTHYGATIQHNFETEIFSVGGSTWYDLYIEQISDNQANTLIPPIGGSPVGATTLHTQPMIQTAPDTGRNIFFNLQWQANPNSSSFRRLIRNKSSLFISGITTPSYALLVNPDVAGDYGLIEQSSTAGFSTLHNVTGPTNLTVVGPSMIVSDTGGVPLGYRASWDWATSSTFAEVFSLRNIYTQTSNFAWLLSILGEANPRLSISPTGFGFGHDGTAATDVTLARNGNASIAGLVVNGSPVARKVSVPGASNTAGLPGDIATGGGRLYAYTGDGTTHSWGYCALTVL